MSADDLAADDLAADDLAADDLAAEAGSLHRGLTSGGAVRFLAVELRGLADRVRRTHDLGPAAARLAGEALVANALMSAWIKGDERIALQLQGESPRFSFVSDVDADGGLRARFTPSGLTRVDGDTVDGLLLAIKSNAHKELYRGMTALRHQRIEGALSEHLGQSDQVDVLVRIDAELDPDGSVRNAAGLVLERLPVESGHPSISRAEFASEHGGLRDQPVSDLLVSLAFGKISGQPVELLENRALVWRCGCSQQRIEAVLYNLGTSELQAILDEDGQAEVVCHFCNIAYGVSGPRLRELLALQAPPS